MATRRPRGQRLPLAAGPRSLTVIPGYDDRKIRTPGIHAARQDGETYRVLWEEAIRADPDWILITSWNEWHEGSEIEPSREHGVRELKRTAAFAPKFLRQPTAQPSTPTTVPANIARALRKRFADRTIGVLPDAGAAAYWLLNAGLTLRELSWAEVADPTVLNPRNLPLLLHAGSESYASHGRTDESGQARGDGIAYVEHHTPPLEGGRTLYAWMRMADVAGDDLLYPALFHFSADRLDQE